jgi:branched-chain amino acid transport system substrate-binding protein
MKRMLTSLAAVAVLGAVASGAYAQKKYDPGANDTTIKIGQTMPYSGPASAYGTIGKAEAAYFKMINEQGGINGRKIDFVTVDDGYAPPKTVEMTRRLVEQDEVLFLYGQLGTPPNSAIHKYVNGKKIPHIFLATGASKWNDPKAFPWTIGWQPNYQSEAKLYAAHILKNSPNAKIAILFQNDDYGKDYLKGFKDGLGDKGRANIVSEVSYEVTDPTIDSQIVSLKATGADVFFNITTPKFAAQAIRKVADLGWKTTHYLNQVSASIGSVLVPAGLDKAVGLISMQYLKDAADKKWENDPAVKEWRNWMAKYYPEGDVKDASNIYAYSSAQTLVHVLKACGDNLTRENVMKMATTIKDLQLPMAIPGAMISTTPDDFAPFQSMQLVKFDGKQWVDFSEVISVR